MTRNYLEGNAVFARVNSAQISADQLTGLVKFSGEQLPAAQEAPGFKGFYLLADQRSGKVVSISLWESDDDLRQFEARGARLREEATAELDIAPTPIDLYEVVLQA
jgi:heme-degrading monooxygenase HmoA